MKISALRSVQTLGALALATFVSHAAVAANNTCADFGISYVDDQTATVFYGKGSKYRNKHSQKKREICLGDVCSEALLKDGFYQQQFSAVLEQNYDITFKTQKRNGSVKEITESVEFTKKTCQIGRSAYAPDAINGLDITLSILSATSQAPDGYPTMGAVVQRYNADGSYSYQGAGGNFQLTGTGSYEYEKTGVNTAVENAMQSSDFFTLPYSMEYTFSTPTSGTFVQHFAGGYIVFEGTFNTAAGDAEGHQQFAPASLEKASMLLLSQTDGAYSMEYQTFVDADNYRVKNSFGSKTAAGQYVYTQLSANSAVEDSTQSDAAADESYVRVYTFNSPRSGLWQQIEKDSRAKSSGSFILLPSNRWLND